MGWGSVERQDFSCCQNFVIYSSKIKGENMMVNMNCIEEERWTGSLCNKVWEAQRGLGILGVFPFYFSIARGWGLSWKWRVRQGYTWCPDTYMYFVSAPESQVQAKLELDSLIEQKYTFFWYFCLGLFSISGIKHYDKKTYSGSQFKGWTSHHGGEGTAAFVFTGEKHRQLHAGAQLAFSLLFSLVYGYP